MKKQRPWLGPGELATLHTALRPQRQRGGVRLQLDKLMFCLLGVDASPVMTALEGTGEIFFTPLTLPSWSFVVLLTDSLVLLQLGA